LSYFISDGSTSIHSETKKEQNYNSEH